MQGYVELFFSFAVKDSEQVLIISTYVGLNSDQIAKAHLEE